MCSSTCGGRATEHGPSRWREPQQPSRWCCGIGAAHTLSGRYPACNYKVQTRSSRWCSGMVVGGHGRRSWQGQILASAHPRLILPESTYPCMHACMRDPTPSTHPLMVHGCMDGWACMDGSVYRCMPIHPCMHACMIRRHHITCRQGLDGFSRPTSHMNHLPPCCPCPTAWITCHAVLAHPHDAERARADDLPHSIPAGWQRFLRGVEWTRGRMQGGLA